MKKIIIIFVMLLLTQFSVLAHPGSLDSNGGHYNRKTGEYHYHSGEHTEYSGNSSSSTYYPFTPAPTVEPTLKTTLTPTVKPVATATPEPETQYSLGEKIFFCFCIFLVFGIPCIIVLVALGGWLVDGIKLVINQKKEPALPHPKPLEDTVSSKPKKTIIIPDGFAIGSDGLPYKTNRQYGWGREFNVFVTNGGEHFHRSRCKIIKGKKKNLIHRYNAIKKYKPCTYCKPKDYIDDWYIQYKGADKGREQISLK